MKLLFFAAAALTLSSQFFVAELAAASEGSGQPAAFKPFELVGDWRFTNSNTGTRYGGAVKVLVTSADSSGVMRGKISYDGTQTNDVCSTRGIFGDNPADVEVIKNVNEYNLIFNIKCSRGESPRVRNWTLVCANDVCTRPEVLPHGQGLLTLKEKK